MGRTLQLETRFAGRRRRDEAAFRNLVVLTFPVFLVAAIIRAPLAFIGVVGDDGARHSLFGRARQMAHSVIPYCFMG